MADNENNLIEDLMVNLSKKTSKVSYNKPKNAKNSGNDAAKKFVESIEKENQKEKEKFEKTVKNNLDKKNKK